MDAPRWEAFRATPNVPAKRAWDDESSSLLDFRKPRTDQGRPEDIESIEALKHKMRRPSPLNGRSAWETTLQTSLWLAHQDALGGDSPQDRRDSGESSTHGSGVSPVPSRNISATHEHAAAWARYNADAGREGFRDRLGSISATAPIRPDSSYGRPQEHMSFSAHREEQEPAAPRPTRAANLAGIEHDCEKCTQGKPRIKDFVSTMRKLEAAFSYGSYPEIHALCIQKGVAHEDMPATSDMHRFFDLVDEANQIAKQVTQNGPLYLQKLKASSPKRGSELNEADSSLEAMKRQFLSESQDSLRKRRRDSLDPRNDYSLDQESFTGSPRRAPAGSNSSGGDRLPPINLGPSMISSDNSDLRLPSMNPPPTPGRQLPSPPPYNLPSPSSTVFHSSAAHTHSSLPPHPLSPAPSSSLGTSNGIPVPPAIATHTAALQHEVSLKSYALQTLKSEHDKLLAALSRSQTRARALEEKQIVADTEVNTLSEERVRLLERIQELEQNVVEVGKARDEYRMAAVKEGKQYVEIVRMASRLELMAGEERRRLTASLAEAQSGASSRHIRNEDSRQINGEASISEPRPLGSNADRAMEDEICHLRTRCANYEAALQDITYESRRIDEVIASLGATRAGVEKSLYKALGDGFQKTLQGNFVGQSSI